MLVTIRRGPSVTAIFESAPATARRPRLAEPLLEQGSAGIVYPGTGKTAGRITLCGGIGIARYVVPGGIDRRPNVSCDLRMPDFWVKPERATKHSPRRSDHNPLTLANNHRLTRRSVRPEMPHYVLLVN